MAGGEQLPNWRSVVLDWEWGETERLVGVPKPLAGARN
jgi:hypothetical protein